MKRRDVVSYVRRCKSWKIHKVEHRNHWGQVTASLIIISSLSLAICKMGDSLTVPFEQVLVSEVWVLLRLHSFSLCHLCQYWIIEFPYSVSDKCVHFSVEIDIPNGAQTIYSTRRGTRVRQWGRGQCISCKYFENY